MIPVPRWREFYNPLAGLTVARLNAIHAAADRGQHAAMRRWVTITALPATARRPPVGQVVAEFRIGRRG